MPSTRLGAACVEVRVPLHVTGFWVTVPHRDPLRAGSIGAGLLLEPGLRAVVRVCSTGSARLSTPSGGVGAIPAVERVLRGYGGVCVEASSPTPLASGFAVSAAYTLAAAVGAELLSGGSLLDAAWRAHVAEVEAGSGLGDVIAMFEGRGLVVRYAPGPPGIGKVESIYVPGVRVVAVPLGVMDTASMLREAPRLSRLAAQHYNRFLGEGRTLESFLREARSFSLEAGFAPRSLAERLDALTSRGVLVGWYVKKRALVAVAWEDSFEEAWNALQTLAREYKAKPTAFRLAGSPLSLAECYSSTST